MTGVHDLFQGVAVQVFTARMIFHLGIVAGQDAAGIDHCYGRMERFQFLHIFVRIDIFHIDFTEIRLHHPPGFCFPPMNGLILCHADFPPFSLSLPDFSFSEKPPVSP